MSGISVLGPSEVPGLEEAVALERSGAFGPAFDAYRAIAQSHRDQPRWPLECVRLLVAEGRTDEAERLFRDTLRRFPAAMNNPALRTIVPTAEMTETNLLKTLGANCPSDAELRRPLVADDGTSDVIVARGGRSAAVLVFTGLADRIVMPIPVFDRYLAELDLGAVYLRDRHKLAYLGGVRSLAPDYDSTIERLRELLRDMGVETLHTIGNSAGGFGAISYGLDLGAEHMLAFAAPIVGREEVLTWDRRAPVGMQRVFDVVPLERRDAPARIAASSSGHFHLIFGADSPDDRRHAESVKDCARVELLPVEGLAGHGALFAFANAGRLRPLLRDLFGPA